MKCAKCGTEFEGKFCPNCGAPSGSAPPQQQAPNQFSQQQPFQQANLGTPPPKKKGGCLKIGLIVVGVFVALMILVAIFGGNKDGSTSSSATSGSQSSASAGSTGDSAGETVYKVGETATSKDVDVTFLGVEEKIGSEYNKPTDGNVYLICEFEISNNSDKEMTFSSMIGIDSYCDDYSINMSLSAAVESDKSSLDGTIAPGKKLKGVLCYEVPEDWKELEIEIDLSSLFAASNKVKFVATNE